MKRLVLGTLLLVLPACGPELPYKPPPKGLGDYVCSAEQATRVEKETVFCNKETGYNSAYCYLSAIQRVCDEKTNKDAGVPVVKDAPPAGNSKSN